ncbi:MAG: hypothetical protein V7739_00135 [Motiliproteus sp.]
MTNKNFILQRICNFAGKEFDPSSDKEVETVLLNKFNIALPQRRTLDESVAAVASDHEILDLILQYRAMK